MFELITAIAMVGIALWYMLDAGKAKSNLGFQTQMSIGALLIVLAVPLAMGFMWPYLVLGVAGMVLGMVFALVTWKTGQTLVSLLWLIYAVGLGVAVGMIISA